MLTSAGTSGQIKADTVKAIGVASCSVYRYTPFKAQAAVKAEYDRVARRVKEATLQIER